ncbi:MAG TPA: TlpA disulfide reductase family protein [Bryobacteraceae bacterium]|nr:TlpA disulfide reductase family protein [Bryobacteraceae bacterium]
MPLRRLAIAALVASALVYGGTSIIVAAVGQYAMAGDFNTANQILKMYRDRRGITPEYLEAYSWIGRGDLQTKRYQAALDNATLVRDLCLKQLAGRKLDSDPNLPTALGASIEVSAQALTRLGRRDEAMLFLKSELEKWKTTSINSRIQKNINLLTLEGKPAPPLDVMHWVTGPKPRPLSAHLGHPVLLFFWAHWCSDCKQEIPIVQRIEAAFKSRGLEVIAPTQHYGYIAGGQDATPAVETPYITRVFNQYYSGLGNVETPLSEANFTRYGVSTTPTLVLLSAAGKVTLYHPGLMTYDELSAAIPKR